MNMIKRVEKLTKRISLNIFGKKFKILVCYDKKYTVSKGRNSPRDCGRVFTQLEYKDKCVKTKKKETWKGRKWYLSEFMTDDEIVKTIWAAFEACVKHEILEGFKVDNKSLFNPHLNFEALLKISHKEIKRKKQKHGK